MKKVIIIGDGGHSKVIRDMILYRKEYEIAAVLDDKYACISKRNGGLYGPLSYFYKFKEKNIKVIIAIGNNAVRKKIATQLNLKSKHYMTLIHPTATISPTVSIGYGTVVMPHAVVNTESSIGEHCIINTGAIVEHESHIGSYVHISPNATLTGEVKVEEGTHIGAAATIIPGRTIGRWSVIGAGAAVIKSIPAYSTAVGCPARMVKKGEKYNHEVVM
ncbi:acetyltransferase [Virgibacillus sp. W0181]|uniref:acetyltransferase n=1 Tax=Virgibacillus sp. W0181 TaxID=3391581 RepID=UPI003F487320